MKDKQSRPTVSRVLPDGTLIELLYDREACSTDFAVAYPDGRTARVPAFDLDSGERLTPYSPSNNLIATGCVLLPSAIGEFTDKARLLAEVRAFIHRYVDLSPTFEAIAAHYVLLSWVYDAFNELPYIRLRGEFGTGKTRALLAIGSLCYKPFFASGASTVSPIFHILEGLGGTLVLDEADFRFSDAAAEITKILNNGNTRGLPILRTMTNRHRELNPQAFRVFGPKLVAMRGSFTDAALESRFVTENTGGGPLRDDIPIQVPDALRDEAPALRNKLLAWRFSAFRLVASDPTKLVGGLSPRARQTALSLVSLIDEPALREAVCSHVGQADKRLRQDQSVPVQQLMVAAVLAAFEREGTAGAAIGLVTNLFNAEAEPQMGRAVSPKWVGNYVRSALGLHPRKTHGVFAIPHAERPRVVALASEYARTEHEDGPACSSNEQSAASPR
jgi:hypothetical protein